MIYALSGGVPRLVNLLCERALAGSAPRPKPTASSRDDRVGGLGARPASAAAQALPLVRHGTRDSRRIYSGLCPSRCPPKSKPAQGRSQLRSLRRFRSRALINDPDIYAKAAKDPEAFWAGFAKELEWITPWSKVLDWNPPDAKWFVGGKLNVSANCLDRHVRTARRNKAAFIWEGEPGDRRTLTYFDLHRQVCQFANVLKSLGVKKGDRVALYLPLIPELAIAMLACARIGAVHSVVFGGFSAESLRDRINDSQCKLLVTADGG